MPPQSPEEGCYIINKVWELYLLYPIDGASRIALVPDKAIAHTIRICKKPIMAVQTNDAVLLLPSSYQ